MNSNPGDKKRLLEGIEFLEVQKSHQSFQKHVNGCVCNLL